MRPTLIAFVSAYEILFLSIDFKSKFGKLIMKILRQGVLSMLRKRTKVVIMKKSPGESSSRVRTDPIIDQSIVKHLRPSVSEIMFCGVLLILLIAGTYSRNRIWNSELELWTDCVKKSPNKDRPHYKLGLVFLSHGKYREAIAHFNEALQINPNFAEAHNNLGIVFFHQGKSQEAINQFNDTLRIDPNFVEADNNLGNVFFYQGKYQDAINQYNEALRTNPHSAEAHNNLGVVFLNQGNFQEAINQYNEALQINPNFAEAHFNLGNAYLRAGNRGLALKEYDILKAMNPGLADALHQRIK